MEGPRNLTHPSVRLPKLAFRVHLNAHFKAIWWKRWYNPKAHWKSTSHVALTRKGSYSWNIDHSSTLFIHIQRLIHIYYIIKST